MILLYLISTIIVWSSKANNIRGTNNECKYYIAVYQYEKHQPGRDVVDFCEMNGKMLEIMGLTNEFKQLHKEKLKSGKAKLIVPRSIIIDGKIKIPVDSQKDIIIESENISEDQFNRRLAVSGTRQVLVIRANGIDTSTTSDKETLSNKIFGIGDDKLNLRSQYAACSYGKVNFVPYSAAVTSTGAIIENGVGEVNITKIINGTSDQVIMPAMLEAVFEKYGDLEEPDHIMLCLPPGTSYGNWIAYAYVNHWLSVYNDDWCKSPSTQMHEVGHNLGLGHSGYGLYEYGDQSGMMGYSYKDDEDPVMCFNAAKSWQLGWYEENGHMLVNRVNSSFFGRLIGVADYGCKQQNDKVVIKIDGNEYNADHYIAFNRKVGINSGTLLGEDMVLITSTEPSFWENDYTDSTLEAILNAGEEYIIANFNRTALDLVIKVHNITFSTSTEVPSYAEISIELVAGCITNSDCDDDNLCTTDVCITETGQCENLLSCDGCGAMVEVKIKTDIYPVETSWSIREVLPGDKMTNEVLSGSGYYFMEHIYTQRDCLKYGNYEFIIYDDYGDGICCKYGLGFYQLSVREQTIIFGASFGYEEITSFQILPINNNTLLPTSTSDLLLLFNESENNMTINTTLESIYGLLLPTNTSDLLITLNQSGVTNNTITMPPSPFLILHQSMKRLYFSIIEIVHNYITKYQP